MAHDEKLIDFKKILAIMQKNFIVLTRDRVRLMPLVLFPVLMILIFGYTTGNAPKHIPTAVISYDNSELAQTMLSEIEGSETFSVRYFVSTEGEARKLLDSGKAKVIVEIPPHLEDDVSNGKQTGITIIVDESDSAIAATSKQTMLGIIDGAAKKISLQNIMRFQQTVSVASQRILNYNSMQLNQYGQIASGISNSQASLLQAQKLTGFEIENLIDSITLPTLVIPSISSESDRYLKANNTFVSEPPGTSAIRAQIEVLQQSNKLVDSANKQLQGLDYVASKADAVTLQQQEGFQENIVNPINNIHVFTMYDANNLLQPIIYEEKPAYGTGKRTIDFLIASIVALTIFQGAVMGMGRAVAGEKRDGSLTRVFLTPTSNATIIAGTLLFYVIFETLRASFIIAVAILFFNITIEGSIWLILLILFIYTTIATSIGMILSSAVRTEQQFMAMAMLVSLPSMFLAGVFFPIQAMPAIMQTLASFLPLTYAAEALRGVMIKGFSLGMIVSPLLILCVFLILTITVVFMVFTREIE